MYQDIEFEIRTEYPIEYMELIIDKYIELFNIQRETNTEEQKNTINVRIAQTANIKRNAVKLKATESLGSTKN